MEKDQRIETLEDEFKLIKGELKQTLVGVRDFLMDRGLPDSEYKTIMAAIGTGGAQTSMRGELTMAREPLPEPPPAPKEEESSPKAEKAEEEESPPEAEKAKEEEYSMPGMPGMPGTELLEETIEEEEFEIPELELPEEAAGQSETLVSEPELMEQPRELRQIREETRCSIPPVNLLSNLICWTTNVKQAIGIEQLPVLLEVYGVSGHLSPELKEVILHLADIVEPRSENTNPSDVWSQSMLELHGILTGGDAPVHTLKPFWDNGYSDGQSDEALLDESSQPDEVKPGASEDKADKSIKLKLVLPSGNGANGANKEFSINLSPEED